MVVLEENFLVREGNRFNLDPSLPLRLQKRGVLKLLGFPGNNNLVSCEAVDAGVVDSLFERYADAGFPFLILVSGKPSLTIVPPLFFVRGGDEIVWRNDKNEKRIVSHREAMRIISGYRPGTWLEFSDYIWGPETMAGRLAFISDGEQIIELQRGVIPSQLLLRDCEVRPAYSGSLSYFELTTQSYREAGILLRDAGYSNVLTMWAVRSVASVLGRRHFRGFEELAKVAPMPTLEFAITSSQAFVSIDIDWPSQWKEV